MNLPDKPLIVLSDGSVLLEADSPSAESARDFLTPFAELEKSPEHIHTYRISPLSLWNAASAGLTAECILEGLRRYGRYALPDNVAAEIVEQIARYGKVKLLRRDGELVLTSNDEFLLEEILHAKAARPMLGRRHRDGAVVVDPRYRGHLKQVLVGLGLPIEDLAGYAPGQPLEVRMRESMLSGHPFDLRSYQEDSVRAFHAEGSTRGGSGVIVLPCGAGKTLVGIGVMAELGTHTLVLTANITALRQWREELLDKTWTRPEDIGEYSGEVKEIRPITLVTYHILTYRRDRDSQFEHFGLLDRGEWGLVIYDEVHLLPAPVFRITAEIQAKRRLGLTATLVREDGRETDVFSLIGPKRYDIPWRVLEAQGWIAQAVCHEVRLDLPVHRRLDYALADSRGKFRIASENREKLGLVDAILSRHRGDPTLIIGQYLSQVEWIARHLGTPIITGRVPNSERQRLYARFRAGEIPTLVVSKVANFAVDLPDAQVAIQVSGTFGSRQEEAQRLGRIMRPKRNGSPAHFYSLVTRHTKEEDFAHNRQLFLTEQGYRYLIEDAATYGGDAPGAAQESTTEPLGR